MKTIFIFRIFQKIGLAYLEIDEVTMDVLLLTAFSFLFGITNILFKSSIGEKLLNF